MKPVIAVYTMLLFVAALPWIAGGGGDVGTLGWLAVIGAGVQMVMPSVRRIILIIMGVPSLFLLVTALFAGGEAVTVGGTEMTEALYCLPLFALLGGMASFAMIAYPELAPSPEEAAANPAILDAPSAPNENPDVSMKEADILFTPAAAAKMLGHSIAVPEEKSKKRKRGRPRKKRPEEGVEAKTKDKKDSEQKPAKAEEKPAVETKPDVTSPAAAPTPAETAGEQKPANQPAAKSVTPAQPPVPEEPKAPDANQPKQDEGATP
jgi:hypothetical protein